MTKINGYLLFVSLCLPLVLASAAHSQCVGLVTDSQSPFATSVGCNALGSNNNKGEYNTATGVNALFANTTGSSNTATGVNALHSNTTGEHNTAIGLSSLIDNTSGSFNTAVGSGALFANTGPTSELLKAGTSNTAIGYHSLFKNTTGWQNTAIGESVLQSNETGSHNTGLGEDALFRNVSGVANLATGESSLYDNKAGSYNVANGYFALNHATGNLNVAVGTQAGCNLVTGSNNIYIGNLGATTESNVIRIGGSAASTKCPEAITLPAQSATYIAGISGVQVAGAQVTVNKLGQLGITTSSSRFKKDVQSLGSTSEKVLNLRPVSFRYNQADENEAYPLQYGLIAEEVAKVFPELVQYDKEDKPFAIYYNLLTPLLLGELQQQHAESRQLVREIASLRKQTTAQAEQLAAIETRFNHLQRQIRPDMN